MTKLNETERTEFLASNPTWAMSDETITRTFAFGDFSAAMGFVTQVALASEVKDHHPDIDIRWNKVTLHLSTHSEGGLTEKDIALAKQLDALVL